MANMIETRCTTCGTRGHRRASCQRVWLTIAQAKVIEAVSHGEEYWIPVHIEAWKDIRPIFTSSLAHGFTKHTLDTLSVELPDLVDIIRDTLEKASLEYAVLRRRALHSSSAKPLVKVRKIKAKEFKKIVALPGSAEKEECTCCCSCGTDES